MIRNLFTLFLFAVLLFSCAGTKRTQENRTEDYGVNALIIDAVTEYGNGNNAKAETLFKSVLAKDKDNATALYYLSGICFENQDFSSALSYGKQAAEKNSNIWYKIQLCEIYMALQDYDNAASVLEKIVKQEPQVLEYWQQLALIYHVKGDKKGEISVLDRMEERFGVNEMTSMQKFQIYRENKDNKKAEQEIIKLAEAFPSQTKYLSILAEMKMKEKDYQSAFRYYNKVKETDPDNEDINIALANYYMTNKNEDSTFFYLKKTMAQKNIDTQSKIRVIYSVYGREVDTDSLTFERFFSLLETIEKSGDTADCKTYVLLNTGYMRKQDYPRASQTGQEAIKKGCNDYSVFQNVLFAMSTFASPDTMISFANLAIETYPEQPLPYLFKGINQEINEDYRSAVETFEAGVVLAEDDKTIL
ncbi:MAG: tetratricopeptide repeat protein [Bacteroidales bacterium]|nr:tetratricopeptide repeat protein [Bacteroidales bacterium]